MYGLTSLMIADLENQLSSAFGSVSPSLFFEIDSLTDLANALLEQNAEGVEAHFGAGNLPATSVAQAPQPVFQPAASSAAKPTAQAIHQQKPAPGLSRAAQFLTRHASAPVTQVPSQPVATPVPQQPNSQTQNQPIAIVGLAGKYPGAANLQDFWENLNQGRSSIGEIPASRWDVEQMQQMGVQGRWGGFLQDIDAFDPLFFRIAPNLAAEMDPHERLFLETTWAAMEDAGYTLERLNALQQMTKKGIGLFLGGMYHNYHLLAEDPITQSKLGCSSFWVIANRVSHFFNFHGPSSAVETACSSSLTAIHMGCEALLHGEASMVFAGGVNLHVHPGTFLSLQEQGALGTQPQSRALGDGDGYLPGEGVGVVALKRLSAALEDGDRVYGLIRGGAVNHSGRTLQFGIPHPTQQVALIEKALERAGLGAADIHAVEVAANGTNLADAAEVQALAKVFTGKTSDPVRLSGVKSNIGHLEAASGISQLTKVLLQFQHRTWVPTLHSQPLNPRIKLEGTPLSIQLEAEGFDSQEPHRVLINSFGFGGSYASLILESYREQRIPYEDAGPQLLVLSARNEDRLRAQAEQLRVFLDTRDFSSRGSAFSQLAWTLQAGRESFDKRLAFMASDGDEAVFKLEQFLAGDLAQVMVGDARKDRDKYALVLDGEAGAQYLSMLMATGETEKLGRFWVSGVNVPWRNRFAANRAPVMMSLPTYPFERRRYWVRQGAFRFNAIPSIASIPAIAQDTSHLVQTQGHPEPVFGPAAGDRGGLADSAAPKTASVSMTRAQKLEVRLTELIAAFLETSPADLDPEADLSDFGLNSINTMRLLTLVQEVFDFQLDRRAIYQLQNIRDFASYLDEHHHLDPDKVPAFAGAQSFSGGTTVAKAMNERTGTGVFGMDVPGVSPAPQTAAQPQEVFSPAIHRFERQAESQADVEALIWQKRILTYSQLNARANQIARALVSRHLGRGSRVGVCLLRTPDLIATLLAIHKLGAAYVPLDPNYPKQRLQYIAADSRMEAVVLQNRDLMVLENKSIQQICLDQERTLLERLSPANIPPAELCAEDVSHLIYTSGSTGNPKGVVMTHGNVETFLRWADGYFRKDLLQGVLASTSVCFDLSVFEIFWPLVNGGTMVLADHLLTLPELPHRDRVHLINTVPSAMRELLQWGPLPQHIQTVNLAGEPFTRSLADAIYAQPGVKELFNLYGPTEDTVYSLGALLQRESQSAPPIGKPVSGTQVWLAAPSLTQVARGEVGEIFLTGLGLARGYWNQPARTAASFIPDCFSGAMGSRMYRTGDLGKENPTGEIDFHGRMDHQVKIRGFRIELGEIEAALEACQGVARAVVHPQMLGDSTPELVAYVQPQNVHGLDLESLKSSLVKRLPEYMQPAHWMVLNELPQTANGKVDRKKLPLPMRDRAHLDIAYQAPGTQIERLLAGIWAEVLGLEAVGVNDPFGLLGGHSLKAIKVLVRLRHRHGFMVGTKHLLPTTTVAQLATSLEAMETTAAKPTDAMVMQDRSQPQPLSPAQKRLWLINQLHEGGLDGYHVLHGLNLVGSIDENALRKALEVLILRHESLRTVFKNDQGTPHQMVRDTMPLEFAAMDWDQLPEPSKGLESLLNKQINTPFDLTRGPLFRASLVRFGTKEAALVLCCHHIIMDGWSLQILERDLFRLYEAACIGNGYDLPVLEFQTIDLEAWQAKHRAKPEVLERLSQFWGDRLDGVPTVFQWLGEGSRDSDGIGKGARANFTVDQALLGSLKEFCETHETSPFFILLATFKAMAFAYTGSRDFLVGLPVAHRQMAEAENLLGFFINMLPHRAKLTKATGFLELVKQTQADVQRELDHQDYPFEALVEKKLGTREFAQMPLIQTVFNYQTLPNDAFSCGDLEVSRLDLDAKTAHFDLTMDVTAIQPALQAESMHGFVEYDTRLFSAEAMDSWVAQYFQLLSTFLAEPNQPVRRNLLLDSNARAVLIQQSRGPQSLVSQPEWVHHRVAAMAKLQPQTLACMGPDGTLTYAALDALATAYAKDLIDLGVRCDQRVAVVSGRSRETLVALLAIFKAGAGYLPIDDHLPAQRIHTMVQEAGAKVVFHRPETFRFELNGITALEIDLQRETSKSKDIADPVLTPENLAYAIFTSGSTGKPKAVMIPHSALNHLVAWHCQRYPLGAGTQVSWLAGTGFDASVWEIWPALVSGSTLCWPHDEVRSEPEKLVKWLGDSDITYAFCPTPLAEAILTTPLPGNWNLRHLLTGGDRLHLRPGQSFPTELTNHYGPTEDTVVATCATVTVEGHGLPTIGKPLPGKDAWVVSDELDLVSWGISGELHLGGKGLARGYLDRPKETALAFVPNPFASDQPGARMYKTGDLVRRANHGDLLFEGRQDHQVQIRGFRIELGEIEAVLMGHPDVQQAVVILDGQGATAQLLAYVRLNELHDHTDSFWQQAFRKYLSSLLPEYMVPSHFILVNHFVLTSNDKIDRNQLPKPDFASLGKGRKPTSLLEKKVATLWEEVLEKPVPSVRTNFFDLGGQSLLAAKLVSKLRQFWPDTVTMRVLFKNPTIESLLHELGVPHEASTPWKTPEMPSMVPASFEQQRLWLNDRLRPGSTAYNVPIFFDVTGFLDLKALEHALEAVTQRHDSLRTSFREENGQVIQTVASRLELAIEVRDLRKELDMPLALQRCMDQISNFVFDLGKPPLFRATYLRTGDSQGVLAFVFHHIVVDGWSVEVLLNDLGEAYTLALKGEPLVLPAPKAQFAEIAIFQRQRFEDGKFEKDLAYWKQHLDGVETVLECPADHPRPPQQSFEGKIHSVDLSPETVQRLVDRSREWKVTPFVVLLGTTALWLSRLSGRDDFLLGLPVTFSERTALDDVVGLMVTTLPFRIKLKGNPTFLSWLQELDHARLEALEHSDVPFDLLANQIGGIRDGSRNPLIQSMFAFRPAKMVALEIPNAETHWRAFKKDSAQLDLTLEIVESLDQATPSLHVDLEYASSLFEESTIERWAAWFEALLGHALEAPEHRVQAIGDQSPMLLAGVLEGEKQKLGDGDLVVEKLELQAAKNPQLPALIYCPSSLEGASKVLTYGEFNAAVNRLAHHLQSVGVGPEVPVAVYMNPGEWQTVALWAVLKAGGVFVPLDPTHGEGRHRDVLADVQPRLVLTEAHQKLPIQGYEEWVLDPSGATLADYPATNPARSCSSGNTAYIIHTSGTTGKPKGVAVSHRALANYTTHFAQRFQVGPDDGHLAFASISFDASLEERITPFTAGAKLVVKSERLLAPAELCQWLAREEVTIVSLPTAYWHVWCQQLADTPKVQKLRLLVVGGEQAEASAFEQWRRHYPNVTWCNAYGPTETTISSTFWIAEAGDDQKPSHLPIGKPIANTQMVLCDGLGRPVLAGLPGELFIAGQGLASGYWKNPGETALRFRPNPFAQEPGDRVYRTGDWVDLDVQKHELKFQGRQDRQVKLRGYRIEPGEIEKQLKQFQGVDQVWVTTVGEAGSAQSLIALLSGDLFKTGDTQSEFMVAEDGVRESLTKFLLDRLPVYMVPDQFLSVSQWPITTLGKIDFAYLNDRLATAKLQFSKGTPLTEKQDLLVAEAWEVLFPNQEFFRQSNFFKLGGNSLLATQLVKLLEKAFGIGIHVRFIFQNPTLAAQSDGLLDLLANSYLEKKTTSTTHEFQPLVIPEGDVLYPLPPSQRRLWWIEKMHRGMPAYNMPFGFRWTGNCDVRALEETFRQIIQRHDSLRTYFDLSSELAQGIVAKNVSFNLTYADLSGLNDVVCEDSRKAWIYKCQNLSMRLDRAPIFHVDLLKLASGDYVLLVLTHHLVFDGVSWMLMQNQIEEIYSRLVHGQQPELKKMSSFADFSHDLAAQMGDLDAHVRKAAERLRNVPPVLNLPADKMRPAHSSGKGHSVEHILDADTTRRLETLGQERTWTPFMVYLTAAQIVMARFASQNQFMLGIPFANRKTSEDQTLIGMLVETLCIKADVNEQLSFEDLVGQVRSEWLETLGYAHVPFESLVEVINPPRTLGQHPLFQVTFNFLPGGEKEFPNIPGAKLGQEDMGEGVSHFDMSLGVQKSPEKVHFSWDGAKDLFEEETIRDMLHVYVQVLQLVARHPGKPLHKLLGSNLNRALPKAFQGKPVDVPQEETLVSALLEQCAKTPDRIAVCDAQQQMTFSGLEKAAKTLAVQLREAGVYLEERVGVWAGRNVETMIGFWGISLAGAVPVPLDPEQPLGRIQEMLQDMNATRIVNPGLHIPDSEQLNCESFAVNPVAEAGVVERWRMPPLSVDNLAYVIFTSGSTGRPKGVGVSHGAAMTFAKNHQNMVETQGDEPKWVGFNGALVFDGAVQAWIRNLDGHSLLFVPHDVRRDGERFISFLNKYRVQYLDGTPTGIRLLVDAGLAHQAHPLEVIFIGGEAILPDLWDRLAALKGVRSFNVYGPTESAVNVTSQPIVPGTLPHLGTGLWGVRLYLIHRNGNGVSKGVPGELCLAGPRLARGYIGRPGLTAAAFVPEADSEVPGSRMYTTGDLVRRGTGDLLQFLGRIDHQVKLHGYRLELGEIEARIAAVPGVAQVAVLLREDQPGNKRLVAYVTAQPSVAEQALRTLVQTTLTGSLPGYMVPSVMVFLPEMPLTASGKISRRLLPVPEVQAAEKQHSLEHRHTFSRLLAELWEQSLGSPPAQFESHFFEVGGHSLLASRLMAEIRQRFHLDIPMRVLFEAPTFGGLLARVLEKVLSQRPQTQKTRESREVIPRADRRMSLPLSFAQQRLWFIDKMEPGLSVYNIPVGIRIHGPFSLLSAQAALDAVIARHEVLRTRFGTLGNQPVQEILPPKSHPILVVDGSGFAETEGEPVLSQVASRAASDPFNIPDGPHLRAVCMRVAPADHYLMINVHHIAFDGWSVGIFMRDFKQGYENALKGIPAALPELAIQYADYASWQRQWLRGKNLKKHLSFWQEYLRGAPTRLELKTDRPRPKLQTFGGGAIGIRLDREISEGLKAFCRGSSWTPFMVTMAVYNIMLRALTGSDDFLVGTPIANRHHPQVSDIIGFFANTLVVRTKIPAGASFRQVMVENQGGMTDAFDYQDLPFDKLVETLNPERDLSRSVFFQVMFAFQNLPGGNLSLPGVRVEQADGGADVSRFDMTWGLVDTDDGIQGGVEYNTDLFDASTIVSMIELYSHLLKRCMENPDEAIDVLLGQSQTNAKGSERVGTSGVGPFWKSWLSPKPTAVDLPVDVDAVQSGEPIQIEWKPKRATVAGLQKLSKEWHVAPKDLLMTLWTLLLQRMVQQQDWAMACGTQSEPSADESEAGTGWRFHALRVPELRTRKPGEAVQILQQAREISEPFTLEVANFAAHLGESLAAEMRHALDIAYGWSEGPALANSDDSRWLGDLQIRLALVARQSSNLNLTLYADASRFQIETLKRMKEQLDRALTSLVSEPHKILGRLALQSSFEMKGEQHAWQGASHGFASSGGLVGLFEEQVTKTPGAEALIAGSESWTYEALNHRANQLAHELRARGIGPGHRVGLRLRRNGELVIAILAVLKAGAAYVPVDPNYPQDRQQFMLEDGQVALELTSLELSEDLDTSVEQLAIDASRGILDDHSVATPSRPADLSDHLAYVIYTSGSTGKPKGVAMTHGNACALIDWARNHFQREDFAGVLAGTSVCFDLSIFELFTPLSVGGTILLTNNILEWSSLPSANKITLINTVPSAIAEVVKLGSLPTACRVVNLAGEPFEQDLIQRVYAAGKIRAVYNLYGPSEDTTYSTWALMPNNPEHVPHIGVPIDHTQGYVLDQLGESTPLGCAGELVLAGAGVAQGYLERPRITAEKFIPNPFTQEPGGRIYRTGDLVRRRMDGTLLFLGRIDHQVKIRGFRIELGEIQTALVQHDAVEKALVTVYEAGGDKRLVAYIQAPDGSIDEEELRQLLSETLPEYMVPSFFVMLENFPLTPNGKIDRKQLPEPTAGVRAGNVVLPKGELQEKMHRLWLEVLRLPQCGVDDNFFKLGGHSLLATQLISQIRDSFGVTLPLKAVFQAPTIAGLCDLLAAEIKETGQGTGEFLQVTERPERIPLSFSQQRLWFIDRIQPGNPAYNLPLHQLLMGEVDKDRLQQALDFVVARHETLRTQFAEEKGYAFQVVDAEMTIPIAWQDLSDHPDQETVLLEMARDEALYRFDLESGPLLRVTLVKLSDNCYALLCCMHHIISDGYSVGVFLGDLGNAYRSFVKGDQPAFEPLKIHFADFAIWQRKVLEGDKLNAQLNYWREHLGKPLTQLDFPTDYPRPRQLSYLGGRTDLVFDSEVLEALRKLGEEQGATMYMVMLSAFNVLLGRYAGQTDVVVGSPIAGRQFSELQNLIGFFVNTLVLRNDLSGNPTFREVLDRVLKTTLDAYANQDVPFERLVEELQPERDPGRNPLFQVMFTYNNNPVPDGRLGDITVQNLFVESGMTHFDMTLAILEYSEGLAASLTFSSDLFKPETMGRMMEHFGVLLHSIANNPEMPIEQLNWLPEEEAHQVLHGWNATKTIYPGTHFLQSEFEKIAQANPHLPAVIFEGECLTYAEFDQKANQLAHRLIAEGVGPEVLVGVCMHRSMEMVLSLYAVLKAGGIYVPMDPDYPEDRLAYMLEDAGAKVLLTQAALHGALPDQAIILDVDTLDLEGYSRQRPNPGWGGEQGAYMIYTSGSTGKPKGALNRHLSILNRLYWMQEAFGLNETDRVLQKTPFSFDVSVWEFFWPLMTGASLVVAAPGVHRDSEALVDVIVEEQITTLHFVPSMLQAFLENQDASMCAGLRRVICSGEALPAVLRDRFFALLPGVELHNLYGPTEAAIDVTWWACDPEKRQADVPIGRPIANTQIYILDQHLQTSAIGLSGELHIAGVNLARGYHGKPGLTAEKFIPDPFATVPGARAYKTGDLVRWQADGAIQYQGRIDHQVKLRGFRIELGEIEAVLCQHARVDAAVAVIYEDPRGDQRLVAYVLTEAGAEETEVAPVELQAFLKERLPEYMVPNFILFLDEFPTTPNGKVDRKALPKPDLKGIANLAQVPPRHGTERRLAAIWEAILEVEPVGAETSFFELGGHSLLVIPMLEQVRKDFGVKLPIATLFEYTTVRALAPLIDQKMSEARPSPLVTLKKTGSRLPLFFVHAVGGHLLSYTEMARSFPKDRPLHAFELVDIQGNPKLQDMAAYYITAMRKVQPEGPYHIGGWSLGGILAQEMARQLKADGVEVGLVALVDSWIRFDELLAQTERETRHAIIYASELNSRYGVGFFVSHEELVGLDFEGKYKLILERFEKQVPIASQFERDMLRQIYEVTGYFIEESHDYKIQTYPGQLTLFVAENVDESAKELVKEGLGWAEHTTEPLIIERVPGDHVTMLRRPQVSVLLGALERHLRKVEEASAKAKKKSEKDPSC